MKRKGAVQLSFILGLLILTIALGLVSYLVQQPQEVRKRAEEQLPGILAETDLPAMASYGRADDCQDYTYGLTYNFADYNGDSYQDLVIESGRINDSGNRCLSFWANKKDGSFKKEGRSYRWSKKWDEISYVTGVWGCGGNSWNYLEKKDTYSYAGADCALVGMNLAIGDTIGKTGEDRTGWKESVLSGTTGSLSSCLDYDSDGETEVLALNSKGEKSGYKGVVVTWDKNNNAVSTRWTSTHLAYGSYWTRKAHLGSVDGEKIQNDFVLYDRLFRSVIVFTSQKGLVKEIANFFDIGSTNAAEALGDVNGDGLDDLVYFVNPGTKPQLVFAPAVKNENIVSIGSTITISLADYIPKGWQINDMESVDVNNDGISDVVLGGGNGFYVFMMKNDFSIASYNKMLFYTNVTDIHKFDIDGDGKIDDFAAINNGENVLVYLSGQTPLTP
ncbi:MAG TPA: hypothetical protein P5299_03170, partial [Candidatus Woesebacteria bacterium]|nr:hypothetical protein [Candidatus Woesebacteria bacterium]